MLLWPLVLLWLPILLSSMITWCYKNLCIVFLAVICILLHVFYYNLKDAGGFRFHLSSLPLTKGSSLLVVVQRLFKYSDSDRKPDALWGILFLFKTSLTIKKFSSQWVELHLLVISTHWSYFLSFIATEIYILFSIRCYWTLKTSFVFSS